MSIICEVTATGSFLPLPGQGGREYPSGATVELSVKRTRNLKLLRKAHVLCGAAHKRHLASSDDPTVDYDDFRDSLTIAAGFKRLRQGLGGEAILGATSWAAHATDEAKFQELYSGLKSAIWQFVLPELSGQDRSLFEQELLGFD